MVPGIPGLKSETWGTLRVFPVSLVGKEDLCTGLSPVPFTDGRFVVSKVAVFRVRDDWVHQRVVKDEGSNRKARLGFPWRAFS